jgi:hypothetical protein
MSAYFSNHMKWEHGLKLQEENRNPTTAAAPFAAQIAERGSG